MAHKNLFHQSPEVLFQIGVGGEPEREPADPGTPGTTTILRPFFRDHRVSWCQKRTSGLYGARED